MNLGVYFSNYELNEHQGEVLAEYLNNGGNLYMEGRSTWIDDIQTAVHDKFNINVIHDSWFLIDTLFGVTGLLSENMMFVDSTETPINKYYFDAVSPAEIIFYNNDTTKGYVSIYDAENYKVIASSVNFGELAGIAPDNKNELFSKYLEFFKVGQNSFGINETFDKNKIKVKNYPNPFSKQTTLDFSLETSSKVSIDIFDINGRKINSLINRNFEKGNHKIVWNANDNFGKTATAGIYFYRIKTDKYCGSGKMILMNVEY